MVRVFGYWYDLILVVKLYVILIENCIDKNEGNVL